mgnify:CR=1 FL=1
MPLFSDLKAAFRFNQSHGDRSDYRPAGNPPIQKGGGGEMEKYFLTVNAIPLWLEDNLTDEEAGEQAREQEAFKPGVVQLWKKTPDRGAVNVAF